MLDVRRVHIRSNGRKPELGEGVGMENNYKKISPQIVVEVFIACHTIVNCQTGPSIGISRKGIFILNPTGYCCFWWAFSCLLPLFSWISCRSSHPLHSAWIVYGVIAKCDIIYVLRWSFNQLPAVELDSKFIQLFPSKAFDCGKKKLISKAFGLFKIAVFRLALLSINAFT